MSSADWSIFGLQQCQQNVKTRSMNLKAQLDTVAYNADNMATFQFSAATNMREVGIILICGAILIICVLNLRNHRD